MPKGTRARVDKRRSVTIGHASAHFDTVRRFKTSKPGRLKTQPHHPGEPRHTVGRVDCVERSADMTYTCLPQDSEASARCSGVCGSTLMGCRVLHSFPAAAFIR
jgi:hypothetical protein